MTFAAETVKQVQMVEANVHESVRVVVLPIRRMKGRFSTVKDDKRSSIEFVTDILRVMM